MKRIYLKKNRNKYQRGFFIFISDILILEFAGLIGMLIIYAINLKITFGISFWTRFIILTIVSIITTIIFILVAKKETSNKPYGIDFSSYLFKKLKLKKTPTRSYVEIIGEYEYQTIFNNIYFLLNFYKKCKTELEIINKEKRKQIDFGKYRVLNEMLDERIDILEKINNLKLH